MNRKISICIEQIKSTTRHIQDDYIITLITSEIYPNLCNTSLIVQHLKF